jgi:hypothetical protein
MTRIEMLQEIVHDKQCKRIRIDGRKVYVDLFTASACVAVYNALNETNRAKYLALPWPRFINVTWKAVRS